MARRCARSVDRSRGGVELGLYLRCEIALLIDELGELPRAHPPLELARAARELGDHPRGETLLEHLEVLALLGDDLGQVLLVATLLGEG